MSTGHRGVYRNVINSSQILSPAEASSAGVKEKHATRSTSVSPWAEAARQLCGGPGGVGVLGDRPDSYDHFPLMTLVRVDSP